MCGEEPIDGPKVEIPIKINGSSDISEELLNLLEDYQITMDMINFFEC